MKIKISSTFLEKTDLLKYDGIDPASVKVKTEQFRAVGEFAILVAVITGPISALLAPLINEYFTRRREKLKEKKAQIKPKEIPNLTIVFISPQKMVEITVAENNIDDLESRIDSAFDELSAFDGKIEELGIDFEES